MEVNAYFFCSGTLVPIMGKTVNKNLEWRSSPSGNGKRNCLAYSIIFCSFTLHSEGLLERYTQASNQQNAFAYFFSKKGSLNTFCVFVRR